MNKKMGIVIAITLVIITVMFFVLNESSQTVVTGDDQLYTQKICTLPGNMVRVEINDKGVTTRLEKEENKWTNLDFEELIYDDWSIHLWLTELRNVMGENVEGSDDISGDIYEDLTIITIYDEMNNSQTFKVARNKDQTMYVDTDDIDGVYDIPDESKGTFNQNINEFVINTIDVPGVESIDKITIESNTISTFKKQNDEWIIEDYYLGVHRGNSESVDGLITEISGITIKDYEGIVTAQNDYGVSESKLKITINDKTEIKFGDIQGDKIYVKVNEDTPFVYSVPYESIKQLESIDMFRMLNPEVININIDNKNEIIFENPQGKYVFKIGYEDTKSEDLVEAQINSSKEDNNESVAEDQLDDEISTGHETDDEETDNGIMMLNEKEITREEAEALIDLINSSVYLEVVLQHPGIEQKEDRPAESTITFTNSRGEVDKIECIPYDINYYLLRMNGAIEFAVNKDKITTLFSRLNTLAN